MTSSRRVVFFCISNLAELILRSAGFDFDLVRFSGFGTGFGRLGRWQRLPTFPLYFQFSNASNSFWVQSRFWFFAQNNCVMIFGSLGVPAISCHTPKFKIPLPTTRLQDFKWSHWPKIFLLKVTDSKDFPPQTPARPIPATAPVPEKSYKSPPYFRPLIP